MWKQPESTDERTDRISCANMFAGWYSASKKKRMNFRPVTIHIDLEYIILSE